MEGAHRYETVEGEDNIEQAPLEPLVVVEHNEGGQVEQGGQANENADNPPTPPERPTSRQSRASSGTRNRRSYEPLSFANVSLGPQYDDPELQRLIRELMEVPAGPMVLNIIGHQIGQGELDQEKVRVEGQRWLQGDRARVQRHISLEQTVEDHRLDFDRLLSRVENIHGWVDREMNPSVSKIMDKYVDLEVPNNFSPVPTLFTSDYNACKTQRENLYKWFPGLLKSGDRFGGKKDSPIRIQDFLNSITEVQRLLNLSKEEFMKYLPKAFVGEAYDNVATGIKAGNSIGEIYIQLLNLYDNTPSPSTARQKLENFKAIKGVNLSKLTGNILQLVHHTSQGLPSGPGRKSHLEFEGVQALIRSLPEKSANRVRYHERLLNNRLMRPPTFTEICSQLSLEAEEIEADIMKNGKPPKNEYNKDKTQYNKDNKQGNGNKKSTQDKVKFSQGPSPTPKKTVNVAESRPKKTKPKKGGNDMVTKDPHGRPYCSLCGYFNHNSVDGCRNMRANNNQIVETMPIAEICKICKDKTRNPLYHQEEYCPYREPHGMFYKRAQAQDKNNSNQSQNNMSTQQNEQ